MGDKSTIEWTDATWNPLTGCTRVSAGCDNCYAATQSAGRLKNHPAYEGLAVITPSGRAAFNGKIRLLPERLDQPLRWKRPRRIFVNSMSDLFHPSVSDEYIAAVFGVMAAAPQHTFQVLTKRPERMAEWFRFFNAPVDPAAECMAWAEVEMERELPTNRGMGRNTIAYETPPWPLPNVHLGTSIENQAAADQRILHLLRTPAARRFLSCEPLLGPVKLLGHLMQGPNPGMCLNCGAAHGFTRCPNYGRVVPQHHADYLGPACDKFRRKDFAIDQVIVGGESGRRARPMHPDWARSLRDQCTAAGVAFHFKQWGEWVEFVDNGPLLARCSYVGIDGTVRVGDAEDLRTDACMGRIGKKAAGRLLDGREWNEEPEVPHA